MSSRKKSNKSPLVDAVRNQKPLSTIRVLCENASINDIREACRIANMHNISLEGGYHEEAQYLLEKLPG